MAAAARRPATPRTHRNAVTRMLRATGLANVPEEAPLVEYVKELAKEMDEEPSSRTKAAYLSALKDVRRVLDGGSRFTSRPRSKPAPKPSKAAAAKAAAEAAAAAATESDVDRPNNLVAFKQKRGIAS